MRTALVLLALLGFGGLAFSDPPVPGAPPAAPAKPEAPAPVAKPAPPLTPEQAADAVLAAVKAKDDAALKALAAKDDPDPWLVADELIRRGEHDAAEAFAKAAPRVDVEKLPAYVASRRGKPDDAARRARLAAANAALGAGRPADAIEALGAQEPGSIEDVVGVRLAMGRGLALASLVQLDASAAAFLAAGEAGERLGWLAQASRAFHESGLTACRGSAVVAGRSAFERGLAVCEQRADQAGAARTLGNIGSVYYRLRDYAKALATHERALAALEALGDKAGAAATLGNIGLVYFRLGDYEKALLIYERALAAQEALGDQAGVARTLGYIGSVYKSLGDYAKALSTQERALAAKEALGDKTGAANTLNNIGNVYSALADHAKALATYERALAAQEALGDKAGAARTLGNIGIVHVSLGEYAKALATLDRALAAKEALGDRAEAATTLGNIGDVHHALGDYAKALEAYERALAAKEELRDKAGAATTLGNLGGVYYMLGDYAKALATHERALAAKEALGDKAGAASTLGNIGIVHVSLGEYAKALATYERALAAKEALGDKAGAASTLINIGNVYNALGDYAKALATYERALAAKEALGDKAGAATTLVNIGTVYYGLGDFAKALSAFERANRAAEELGAIELQVGALRRLAEARLRSGDATRAIEAAHKAVALLKTLVGGLGEEQGATARAQYVSLFSTGLRAAAKANAAPEAAFFFESGRAGTLLESLGSRGSLRAALVPEELRVAEVSARAREARALVAYRKALDANHLATIRARGNELEATRAGIVEVVERIQRDAKKAARVLYPVATPVKEIQALLATEEALVLYGLAEKDDFAHALVLTRGESRIVALGSSSALVAACEALEAQDASVDPAAAFERLRTLLIAPLGLSKTTKRLLVSPEGALSYMPFAAFVPDLEVAYQPSGTTYGVLLEERDKRGTQVLALRDPDYAVKFDPTALDVYAPVALAAAGGTRGGRLAPLPGTRAEATAIADVRLFGTDASEPGLRAALGKKKDRWHAVHFACHGLVNPDRPTLSSLALTPEGENDGFLTALEVFKMEIPSDLVVLSACETGKGKIAGGEGIVGLTRAFMFAGSPRVICSLWKVDDAATKALMVKFYELWNPKDPAKAMGTAAALKAAQEYVRTYETEVPDSEASQREGRAVTKRVRPWEHPYYWAAWVLWGLPS